VILIGQFDSPFVRRVGIALELYGLAYEHRPWSTFRDAELIAPYNPLRRVPTLVLDSGESLIESVVILDHLDEVVGAGAALIADSGPARREALKVCALATGLADKAVSLVYEGDLHRETSSVWIQRCESQIRGVLSVLEADRSRRTTPYWSGSNIGHADIAVACALRFLREAHARLFREVEWPSLAAHALRCEALTAFKSIAQPFIPPA
jgi:glutathione S-transferase